MSMLEMQPTDSYFDANGVRLHYADWGALDPDALTVVLLHGLQDCARSWDIFAAAIRSDYRVIALDHRGHGDSAHATADTYGFRDYVADLEALVSHLGLRDFILVGHSAGARYAFVFAAEHPELIRALVVVDIDPDAVNPDSQGMFARYNSESDEWDSLEAVVERLRDRQPQSTDEMLRRQAEVMTRRLPDGKRVWKRDRRLLAVYERPDLWEEWGRIIVPTLIVRGRQSNLLTHEVAVRMREAISGTAPLVRLAELEGGGHWFYQEFPGAFEMTFRWFMRAARDASE
jgi:pimeloyl-ACP methyl ester carboxylesterase